MTSKLQAVQDELAQLKQMLAGMGIMSPRPAPASDKDRADYIEFGSAGHMALLGLIYVETDAEKELYITHESNGKAYRLGDEITAFVHHHNPEQVARLTLRQKVSELEAGKPPISAGALPLWTPVKAEGETWTQVALGQA